MTQNVKQPIPKAFVSCSLRKEDSEFVEFVCNILSSFQIQPFGTVGKYSASTDNPTVLMKKNIKEADFVVIIATKRYFTKDAHSKHESNTLSEMVHTEAGMAYANDKPIVVFVEEGTKTGSFLSSITQYIVLNKHSNIQEKIPLITDLLNDAWTKARKVKQQQTQANFGNTVLKTLAIYGSYKLFFSNSSNENV